MAVSFEIFLSATDAARVRRTLAKLAALSFADFALTGSLALEWHLIGLEDAQSAPTLNDIDLVVQSFEAAPDALASAFLARHIHPRAPEGKLLVQLVDAEEALRIDVFRAYGATLRRARTVDAALRLVSLDDLAVRGASLLMDLDRGMAVPEKHARDFLRCVRLVDPQKAEAAWREHRKPDHPATFVEASGHVRELLRLRDDLLVNPEYSRDIEALCPKCEETGLFRLAPAQQILDVLGYC